MTQWHRHLGVYGIYSVDNQLLVVEKTRGPYIHRYDLPGGSFDPNESMEDCLIRELKEEVGEDFQIQNQVGIFDYLVPWDNQEGTHVHHLAIYFTITLKGELTLKPVTADDTSGYKLVALDQLTLDNASPLVVDGVRYLKEGGLPLGIRSYEDWQIKVTNESGGKI